MIKTYILSYRNIYVVLLICLWSWAACSSNQGNKEETSVASAAIDSTQLLAMELLDSCLVEVGDSIVESELVKNDKKVVKKKKKKAKKKKVKPKPRPPRPMRTEIFKGELEKFLLALKQVDMPTIVKYSTDAGLRSFLATDYDEIYSYQVFECEADEYVATANVSFNNNAPLKLYFNRKGGKGNYLFLGAEKWH